ncbi:hypothetical protein KKC83_05030 [Patescibacteria group bacterium]|nr:hypothetical protein [Patescibacteria group bacterium]MCG2697884.1 hypothetical protein [Candidatus Parcubacteria bacterium]MBU4026881.1 hypothetical protein [Patescibacteria group bacterium]MBU4073445.1 hypothetical protein [Patescibacteria group bacterium]MBU4103081.1 hypothetical protein [Patescibacteria group bacterium]
MGVQVKTKTQKKFNMIDKMIFEARKECPAGNLKRFDNTEDLIKDLRN